VEGDQRTNKKIRALKALCVLLYAVGKASFNMLAYLFQSWPSLIYRWIVEAGLKMPEPKITKELSENKIY